MYITTFYSFKGGVGRTLALMNCAAELCARGKKVLVVDFDLEAPGLESFQTMKNSGEHPGIVEFITAYLNSGEAPKVEDYVYECSSPLIENGGLWVMPAGKADDTYGTRLNQIDWQDLYENHDGYLLLEDLKAQWKKIIQPDYVLIDSRTGHTDVSGICTRQLPDAVVVLFFPNMQNLAGLSTVVNEIRYHSLMRSSEIYLHFVMSNVPDLDDEGGILEQIKSEAEKCLEYNKLHRINHYSSLSLLDQEIFTISRRKTRLAKEYMGLVDEIIKQNISDRSGVRAFLLDLIQDGHAQNGLISIDGTEERLNDLQDAYGEDAEILYYLASLRMMQGIVSLAYELVNRSINLGNNKFSAYSLRALAHHSMGDKRRSVADLIACLHFEEMPLNAITDALRRISEQSPNSIPEFKAIPALRKQSQSDLLELISILSTSLSGLKLAGEISDYLRDKGLSHTPGNLLRLSLIYIGLGRFQEAKDVLGGVEAATSSDAIINTTFNFAMADWGAKGKPSADLFKIVIDKSEALLDDIESANYFQCMAIAHYAVGDLDKAREMLRLSGLQADNSVSRIFSCWRYQDVMASEFQNDLSEIKRLINGEVINPRFMAVMIPT